MYRVSGPSLFSGSPVLPSPPTAHHAHTHSPTQTVEPPPRSAAGHADEPARAASAPGKAASEPRERLPGHLKITAVEATDLMPVTEKDCTRTLGSDVCM